MSNFWRLLSLRYCNQWGIAKLSDKSSRISMHACSFVYLFYLYYAGLRLVAALSFLLVNLVLVSLMGVFWDLKFINYYWSSIAEVVKQGKTTLFTAGFSLLLIILISDSYY